MKRSLSLAFVVTAFSVGLSVSKAQTTPPENPHAQNSTAQKTITLKPNEPETLAYDGGTARILAASEQTNGAWSLVELQESSGYHTNLHRHNQTDEAFYVLEGMLTVFINGSVTDFPAGSYVFVPRGTPHAQGNRGKTPVKVLLTMTPGGFERSFLSRIELFKTTKPDDPDFRKKRKENTAKGKFDVEFIENWTFPK